jgi:hypothetical protein
MTVIINGDTGISPVTASGTSASVDGMTVGRGGGAVATNTAVGASAMAATATGQENSAFGNSALKAVTSGQYNTGIGFAALEANTTASANTAVGDSALRVNTTGASNVAMGESALAANTTASNNTAVGYQAGTANTTGRITAVGHRVLYGNTTGTGNTGVGGNDGSVGSALLSNTTGSYNIAVGTGALLANTTASYGTAIGYQAGYSAVTADYNTFVGYKAGFSTTGGQNTFLGKFAGNAITTGTTHTIIGAYNGNQGGLDIRTNDGYVVLSDGGGNPRGYFDNIGRLYVPASYTYTTGSAANMSIGSSGLIERSTSSLKYKRDVNNATHGLAEVLQLRPVTYKGKSESDGEKVFGGLIAEEVDALGLTEFVQYADDGSPDALAYGNMVSLCVKAIQELKTIVDAQAALISGQATEIAELKAKVG